MPSLRDHLRRLLHLDDTPAKIAKGAVVGLFVAMTPPVWPQSVVAYFAARLLRANYVSAMSMTFLTNPLTYFLYVINYLVGVEVLEWTVGWAAPPWREVWARIETAEGVVQTMRELSRLGWRVLAPMTLGGIATSAAGAFPTYRLVYRSVEARRARKEQERQRERAGEKGGGGS